MLPDLGRPIRPLYATVAATAALPVAPGRWRASPAVVGGVAAR
ncbi:MAG TPA: hypothetical protein VGL23_14230 [Chloroflexota bacterium]|jgi:hypothetical protein